MKKMIDFTLTGIVLLLLATSAFAVEYKIAVIDINTILTNTPQVEAMQAKLKNQFEPKIREIGGLQKELDTAIAKYAKNNSTLKEGQRQNMQKIIAKMQNNIRKAKASFQHNFDQAQNQAQQTILRQIQDAVYKIAKKEKYDLVIIKDTVAFNLPGFDISNQVADILKRVK